MALIEKKPAQPNQSIIDGLMLLQAVAASKTPVGCTQLAREYGLDVTRVNRILGTLAYAGMAQRTQSRKYLAGPGIHVLAAMSLKGSHLLGSAMPHLQELSESSGMVVTLGVLWRTQVAVLYHQSPGEPAGAGIGRGKLYGAHVAGIGRMMLSRYTDAEVRNLYADCDPLEDGPAFEIKELLAALKTVRDQGHAVGEPLRSVAVPIGSPAVAAVALGSRKAIAARRVPALVGKLNAAAEAITEAMAAGAAATQ